MTFKFMRVTANAVVSIFCLFFIITILTNLVSAPEPYWVTGIAALLINGLDVYFLTRSMLHMPKGTDTRISTFFISVCASICPAFLLLVSINCSLLQFPGQAVLRAIGEVIAVCPYPFVIWSVLCLKDCLTVVPEAHCLVSKGIYKYSRHPLYMCYITWAVANIMMFPSWEMFSLAILQIVLQVARFRREEALLLENFSEYLEYYNKTGLIGKLRFDFLVGK